jgi:hypothetical protein
MEFNRIDKTKALHLIRNSAFATGAFNEVEKR